MINFLLAFALILFIAILVIYIVRIIREPAPMYTPEEETVTTTTYTTTTTEAPVSMTVTVDQLPTLERHFKENGQPYCIDPADKGEWMLNTNDDMYEDANGKWWRLVDPAVKP